MEIYIEIAILNNLMIDSFIFIISVESCKLKVSWWRVGIATILATTYAVGLPYINWANNFFLKIILSFALISFLARYPNAAKYIFCLMMFYLYTFLLAGITYAVLYAFPNLLKNFMYLPALLGLCALIIYSITKIVFNHIVYTRRQLSFEQKILILNNKNKVECLGFWDSGNTLYYKYYPIIIISKEIANKLTLTDTEKYKKIKVDCVVGSNYLKLARIEKLILLSDKNKIIYNQLVAISDENINYDVILNCDM